MHRSKKIIFTPILFSFFLSSILGYFYISNVFIVGKYLIYKLNYN